MRWLLLVVTCLASSSRSQKFHEDLPEDDLLHYFGTKDKEKVPQYDLVTPDEPHGDKLPERVYNLRALGEEYRLRLRHNQHLIGPGCFIKNQIGSSQAEIKACPTGADNCYYLGSAVSHNGSQAALSTCNGQLHGLIRTLDHDLVVKPVKGEHHHRARRHADIPNPHIVYKRATPGHTCAVAGGLRENFRFGRLRRDTGKYYIEMMLVADRSMHEYHGDSLTDYLLTVANIAAGRFLDPSVGQEMHLTIIRVWILQQDQKGLVLETDKASDTLDAEKGLDNFCIWQEPNDPTEDTDPSHYDGAALMTRLNIALKGNADITGLATVGGMCGWRSRCSINEDTGLDLGLTFSHETGHSLGMSHDGDGNDCENRKNVMSSAGGGGPTSFLWSRCSREALAKFLAGRNSECLRDKPQAVALALPEDLPGTLYDADDQCRLFLGERSTLCSGINPDDCNRLGCFDPKSPGQCVISQSPMMDGTPCGERKWCMKGSCLVMGPDAPKAVDGGWSAWSSEWTACSRTCGGGVRVKTRKCNNPKPKFGGKACEGFGEMAELCNLHRCSDGNFRAEQCAATDKIPMNGAKYHWIPSPATVSGEECQLYCQAERAKHIVDLRGQIGHQIYQDGTECVGDGSMAFSRCVEGKCRAFSCDGGTESQRSFDMCGVCSGKSDTCKKMTGNFRGGKKQAYTTFTTIPKGSTSVSITNSKSQFTKLTVKVGDYLLFNRDPRMSDRSGTYSHSGVTVIYHAIPEKVEIRGPTLVDAEAQVYRMFDDDEFADAAPLIDFAYYRPDENAKGRHAWKTRNSHCSATCGKGTIVLIVYCVQSDSGVQVEDFNCDIMEKPSPNGNECNMGDCPAEWRPDQWEGCSRTCGGGTQKRSIRCVVAVSGVEQTVSDDRCPANSRPSTAQQCGTDECPGVWKAEAWSACSASCGLGSRTRQIRCTKGDDSSEALPDTKCLPDTKPKETERCIAAACNPSITGDKCKDLPDCKSYGDEVCTQFASWAKVHCMLKCGICLKNPGEGTGSGQPDAVTVSSCTDKSATCSGYGKEVCTNEYKDWAALNCQKFCNLCGSAVADSCKDTSQDCAGHGKTVCTDYADWSHQNCQKFCGFCSSGSGAHTTGAVTATSHVTSGDDCRDTFDKCSGYQKSMCTDYKEWASSSCRKYCGLCSSGETVGINVSMAPVVTQSSSSATVESVVSEKTTHAAVCQDTIDCTGYGKSACANYADWAAENCRRFCGFCSGEGTPQPTASVANSTFSIVPTSRQTTSPDSSCIDLNSQCSGYGSGICKGDYAAWAAINCKRLCNLCGAETQSTRITLDIATSPAVVSTTDLPRTTAPTTTALTTTAPTTSQTTTVALTTTTIGVVACSDALDCKPYGIGVCLSFANWAKENCKQFCNLCPTVIKTTQKSTTDVDKTKQLSTELTTATTTVNPGCKDSSSQCLGYGLAVCGQYAEWAESNCRRYCGLCESVTEHSHSSAKQPIITQPFETKPTTAPSTESSATQTAAPIQLSVRSQPPVSQTSPILLSSTPLQLTSSATSVECTDSNAQCSSYGLGVCLQYADWAKQNCQHFCGLCSTVKAQIATEKAVSTTKTPEQATKVTSTTIAVFTTVGDCKDLNSQCSGYGQGVCTQYSDWAKINCQHFCGLCTQTTMTASTAATSSQPIPGKTTSAGISADCEDLIQCSTYGLTACTQYPEWAQQNCAKYCGLCASKVATNSTTKPTSARSTTEPHEGSTTVNNARLTTKAAESSCVDAIANCASYGSAVCSLYADWSRTNCRNYCGLCVATSPNPTTVSSSMKVETTVATSTSTPFASSSSSTKCKDSIDNCESYGKSACTAYPHWAKGNCQKFCALCTSGPVSVAKETTVTISLSTAKTVDETCKDTDSRACASYGVDVCSKYKDWSAANCRLFCGYCEPFSSSKCVDRVDCAPKGVAICRSEPKWAREHCPYFCNLCNGEKEEVSTTAVAVKSALPTDCVDRLNNCESYGQNTCQQYKEWAESNCKRYCGFCGDKESPGAEVGSKETTAREEQTVSNDLDACADVSMDCPLHGQSVCSEYQEWSRQHCQRFCGFCGGGVHTTAPTTGFCSDVSNECAGHGTTVCTQYVDWSRANCQKFCGFCGADGGSHTTVGHLEETKASCQDAQSNCAQYQASVCSDYKEWAKTNCQKFCNLCSYRRKRAVPLKPQLCGSVLTSPEATVDLRGKMTPGGRCVQTIAQPLGTSLTISLETLALDCQAGDQLTVLDIVNNIVIDLCASKTPQETQTLTIPGGSAVIDLTVQRSGSGYLLVYSSRKSENPVGGCRQHLTASSGEVSSPRFPHPYPPGSSCDVYVTAPPAYSVKLSFDVIDIPDSVNCSKSSLTVEDAVPELNKVLCGHRGPKTWVSAGNRVIFRFRSDGPGGGKGFYAKYEFVPKHHRKP